MNKYITIEGFENLTKQQMFDMSAKHILSTKTKSFNEDGNCSYAGTGCAAAPFIREECRAAADVDPSGGAATGWGFLRSRGDVPEHNAEFVRELQYCHDETEHEVGSMFVDEWLDSMYRLAEHMGLDTTVLK